MLGSLPDLTAAATAAAILISNHIISNQAMLSKLTLRDLNAKKEVSSPVDSDDVFVDDDSDAVSILA